MADNRYFVDTNILLTASDSDRDHHAVCHEWLRSAYSGKHSLFLNGQVLREYLVVATRPNSENGLGMQPTAAQSNVVEFRKCIHLLDEKSGVSQTLLELVNQNHLKGKRIHNANIVATMMENGLIQILTINGKDFSKFKEVKVIEPHNLVS